MADPKCQYCGGTGEVPEDSTRYTQCPKCKPTANPKPSAGSRLAGKDPLRWFTDSPDEGSPECLCSLCETVIPGFLGRMEYDAGELLVQNVAIRMWTQTEPVLEARFHDECFEAAVRAGIVHIERMYRPT